MQSKESIDLEQKQKCNNMKSIKVLYSNSHADRPKISMEGKWLEQLGFQIGDRLLVNYGDKFILIRRIVENNNMQPLTVNEPSGYMEETADTSDMDKADGRQKQEDIKKKQIRVTSAIHVRQARRGGPMYYPERSKISMEGKWLQKAGFHIGDRLQVLYQKNVIYLYPEVLE